MDETKKGSSTLARAFERHTSNLAGGAAKTPRKQITFTVDHTICCPGVFDADFDVTLASLTPAMELEAVRRCSGELGRLPFVLPALSLFAVDGEPLDTARGQDEWLWQMLDQGGRSLVMQMFASVGTPGDAALGKAQDSLRTH